LMMNPFSWLQMTNMISYQGLVRTFPSCAFDLEQITKVYDEHKEALKSQYLSIKNEMTDIFKYQFYGSASVPKCFDMFSMFGKDYQVCPDSDGYWEFLAALMMFIFYFTAFIVLTKR
ncbi:hypothetical protein ACK3Z7_04220, partial [Aeromonas caviae]